MRSSPRNCARRLAVVIAQLLRPASVRTEATSDSMDADTAGGATLLTALTKHLTEVHTMLLYPAHRPCFGHLSCTECSCQLLWLQ